MQNQLTKPARKDLLIENSKYYSHGIINSAELSKFNIGKGNSLYLIK